MDTDSDPNGGPEDFFDPFSLPDLDIDELLGSAGLNFDAELNLNDFSSAHHVNDFDLSLRDTSNTLLKEEIDLGFDLPVFSSPASTIAAQPSASSTNASPNYEIKSERSSPTSSNASANADEDMEPFNVDDFLNFHSSNESSNDCRTEEENIRSQRNTPSPVGSYSSSGGSSSSSGIVSDACSVASSALLNQDVEMGYINSPAVLNLAVPSTATTIDTDAASACIAADCFAPLSPNSSQQITNAFLQQPAATVEQQTLVPISVPLLQTPPQVATILQPLPQVQLIPVKTMPIVSTAAPVVNIKTPTGVKQQPLVVMRDLKQEPKQMTKCNSQIVKINTPAATTTTTTTTIPTPTSPKRPTITPPTNSKPKTVYVSSDDYKALMQKMNPTVGGSKGSAKFAGQVPKIVMKTASGKVITTNSNKLVQSVGGIPRVTKMGLSGPMLIKQQPKLVGNSLGAGMPPKPSIVTKSVSSMPEINRYRGLIDEKMYKKQQRMIKNRESASLSRKKKKEYVASLEKRILNLEKENCTLKGENNSLRSQLIALAQTCQCKNGNISEFVLTSLNASQKGGNAPVSGSANETRPIRIAPKPETKSMKERQIRKNMLLLLAVAFMVTFNAGTFRNYFSSNSIESAIEMSAEESIAGAGAATAGGGRRLLWVETESEFKQKHNRTKREVEMPPPPPLHFLHRSNRTVKSTTSDDAMDLNGKAHEPPLLSSKFMSGFSNQTENMRLARDLHKWIDGNDYLNLSIHTNFENDLENGAGFKLPTEYVKIKTTNLPLQRPGQKRKYYLKSANYESKERKIANDNKNDVSSGGSNSLDFFKPSISEEYLRFFKNIKRQDDTFYVLSFNMDHLLLPASNYNKSARPKMSLMLPAGDPSVNGDIVLMQIDCEVMNTTEVSLKSHMIPEKLRPQKFHTNSTPNPNDVVNNETRAFNKPSGTVFLKKDEEEVLKLKPPVKTYFMFGPKTKAAAAAAAAAATAAGKKNVTITKINASKIRSMTGAGVAPSQWKSLPLFAKMKETVENELGP